MEEGREGGREGGRGQGNAEPVDPWIPRTHPSLPPFLPPPFQVINSGAKQLYMSGGTIPVPVVFRGPNGAAAGVGAQHSQDFASWYSQVPGLKVREGRREGRREGGC